MHGCHCRLHRQLGFVTKHSAEKAYFSTYNPEKLIMKK